MRSSRLRPVPTDPLLLWMRQGVLTRRPTRTRGITAQQRYGAGRERPTPGEQPTVLGDASGRFERSNSRRRAKTTRDGNRSPDLRERPAGKNSSGTSCPVYERVSPPHPFGSACFRRQHTQLSHVPQVRQYQTSYEVIRSAPIPGSRTAKTVANSALY